MTEPKTPYDVNIEAAERKLLPTADAARREAEPWSSSLVADYYRREGFLKAVELYRPLVEAVEDLEKDRGFLGDDLRRVFEALHKIQEALGESKPPQESLIRKDAS